MFYIGDMFLVLEKSEGKIRGIKGKVLEVAKEHLLVFWSNKNDSYEESIKKVEERIQYKQWQYIPGIAIGDVICSDGLKNVGYVLRTKTNQVLIKWETTEQNWVYRSFAGQLITEKIWTIQKCQR